MKLSKIINELDCSQTVGNREIEINSLAYDSRRVQPGSLFFAVSGSRFDGHNFVKAAVDAGAAAVAVERRQPGLTTAATQLIVDDSRRALAAAAVAFYNKPAEKLRLIGVTGTNGKTTTSHLIESVLAAAGRKTGLIGTVNYKIGRRPLPAERTTPESLDLQAVLAKMVQAEVTDAVMEVSSHAVKLNRIYGTIFWALVFTNLTQDHLDFHQNMNDYFAAKAELFTAPAQRGAKKIINVDDPYGRRLYRLLPDSARTFGFRPEAEVRGSELKEFPEGIALTVSDGRRRLEVRTRLKGLFNGYNVLAAVAAAWELGLEDKVIKEALAAVDNVPGRFQPVDMGQDFQVIIDYAHTPDGLRQVLASARAITQRRLITVFGCGGDRDRGKRPLMGKIAAELSDRTIITSDNPRGEDPDKIAAEIEAGVKEVTSNYEIIINRYEAIKAAAAAAGDGDLILIAGKGHETGQTFADRTIPFNDREVTVEILGELMNGAVGRG